ncbi:H+-transporting ATPase [Methylacidimicrobium cyclopophantes]|uniref:H+-transporting ATPase n=1 Tax=Methylacidimicrobium cyclopophantes TaxID=1041766 RepID=A0A5E6M9I0_9BACT|nr:HAD-IC family P-type ATPase [Methylacidimicrobium cyclopophantes]VVM04958.1 H+-transporting ATPase [Methylacidimicrobium cyclopophantes]
MKEELSQKLEGGELSGGLSNQEAAKRLAVEGPNTIPERSRAPLLVFLSKFWAPVPWMLEAAIVMEVLLRRIGDAIGIGILLILTALLSFFQENRAERALRLLRRKWVGMARVFRDQAWQRVPVPEIVRGDRIHLRVGDIVPADARLESGVVGIDESSLTGEPFAKEKGAGAVVYGGTVVRKGEATGEVFATGPRTTFGRIAGLVSSAKAPSQVEETIFRIVRWLIGIDAVLVVFVFGYGLSHRLPLSEVLPYALVLLITSVPAALPATFAITGALGAQELARKGVLVRRLAAVENAATMDILAADKTGTVTTNEAALREIWSLPPATREELLLWGAMASLEASEDPLERAIFTAAKTAKLGSFEGDRVSFTPFDPSTKSSSAVYQRNGSRFRVIKGAPDAIERAVGGLSPEADEMLERFSSQGLRILAVAAGTPEQLRFVGFLGFSDPVRRDSRSLVARLHELGIRVILVTGDTVAAARAVAREVGIGSRVCRSPDPSEVESRDSIELCDIFAGVFPEDKFRIVDRLQRAGHVVGMTGDGVNDAPALRQAEVGIAVNTACDVAREAASIALTNPGLMDIVAAVETSREIYERMLTYILNKIIKTVEIAVFLTAGLFSTGIFVLTPFLGVLLLLSNDFITMSLASDRVRIPARCRRWPIRSVVFAAGSFALCLLGLSFAVFWVGIHWLKFDANQLQTLVFAWLAFSGQGMVYVVRERSGMPGPLPGFWLLFCSAGAVLLVSFLAVAGVGMAPLPLVVVVGLLGTLAIFLAALFLIRARIFSFFGLQGNVSR